MECLVVEMGERATECFPATQNSGERSRNMELAVTPTGQGNRPQRDRVETGRRFLLPLGDVL